MLLVKHVLTLGFMMNRLNRKNQQEEILKNTEKS